MINISHKFLIISTTAALGFGLSACSPPHEQPSEMKVDTATSFRNTAPATTAHSSHGSHSGQSMSSTAAVAIPEASSPAFVNQVGSVVRTPSTIDISYSGDQGMITDIEWSTWTDTTAQGVGTYVGADGAVMEKETTVVLSNPATTPDGLVFTSLSLNGERVAR
ncbi:hypothetical protein [Corynebacterium caspium]|uniref:hypothetical protein n=1 Tax=Corynebacterium caspium TaxID=234828 RepID=UPI0003812F84|nr:hypothetical protein [Corynebacterium caspium]WKD59561.1 hypothetical protein CCASP_05870 [Corynebacterium caspium DSM 44850]